MECTRGKAQRETEGKGTPCPEPALRFFRFGCPPKAIQFAACSKHAKDVPIGYLEIDRDMYADMAKWQPR